MQQNVPNKNSEIQMGGNSGRVAKKRGPGRPFQPGQSGNPAGFSKDRRDRLHIVSEALDAAFAPDKPGDPDKLVKAILDGSMAGDPKCMALAARYRWGEPPRELGVDLRVHSIPPRIAEMTDAEIVAELRLLEGRKP